MQTTTLCTCGRVLDHDHVVTLGAAEPELGDRRRPVVEQARPVLRVHPRARHDPGAVHRSDACS